MRAVFGILIMLASLAPLALAHGGSVTVKYVGGSGLAEVCEPTILLLVHAGGACEIPLHSLAPTLTFRLSVTDAAHGAWGHHWRASTGAGASCGAGAGSGTDVFVVPQACEMLTVWPDVGATTGTIAFTPVV